MKHRVAILLVLAWVGASFVVHRPLLAQPRPSLMSTVPRATITSIAPSKITISQGGPMVTVAVTGTYLEDVTSASVIKSGQVQSGFRAMLVDPWPTSGKITFQVARTAPVGSDYQLRAMAKVGTSVKAIDLPLSVFSLNVPAPATTTPRASGDLIVMDVYSENRGYVDKFGRILVAIQNVGTGPVELPLKCRILRDMYDQVVFKAIDRPTVLQSGQVMVLDGAATKPLITGSDFVVLIKVDPDSVIAETNELNNTRRARYSVTNN